MKKICLPLSYNNLLLIPLFLLSTSTINAQTWTKLAAGYNSSYGIKSDGSLWAWGGNTYGQLGDGTFTDRSNPALVPGPGNWTDISTSFYHVLGLKSDGTLWAWGRNNAGQFGNGSTVNSNVPIQIQNPANTWTKIAAGYTHSLAIASDGSLWAWGNNADGKLGDGTLISRLLPVRIGAANNWKEITAGSNHSLGIKQNGTLWAWGANTKGQLGDGTYYSRRSPTPILPSSTWTSIQAGRFHTLGLKTEGSIWSWGFNSLGQLGDGTIQTRNSPIQVSSSSSWTSIATGGSHSHAIKSNGELWSWGHNAHGMLGDNSTTGRTTPTLIVPDLTWRNITAGYFHTLGLKTGEYRFCATGYNMNGQLGDGLHQQKKVFICNGNCNSESNQRFNDVSSFTSALGTSTSFLIDFTTNDNGTLISTTPVPPSGWVRNGFTFLNCSPTFDQFIAGAPTSLGNPIKIIFPAGLYNKAGFDLVPYYPSGGTYTIKVVSGGCEFEYTIAGVPNQAYYFGIITPAPIDRIETTYNSTSVYNIDNFRYSN